MILASESRVLAEYTTDQQQHQVELLLRELSKLLHLMLDRTCWLFGLVWYDLIKTSRRGPFEASSAHRTIQAIPRDSHLAQPATIGNALIDSCHELHAQQAAAVVIFDRGPKHLLLSVFVRQ